MFSLYVPQFYHPLAANALPPNRSLGAGVSFLKFNKGHF